MSPLADIQFETHDRIVVARVVGEIDISNADEIGTTVAGRVSNEALGLVLDLAAAEYFDSAGIHIVFDLRERLRTRGQELRLVVSPGSAVADALRYAAVLEVVKVSGTPEEAVSSIRG
jgi:anti-anti-sigma factor